MTKELTTKCAIDLLPKLAEWYGYSKFHDTLPYLLIEDSPYSDVDDPDCFGEYDKDENELIIYWKNIKGIDTLYMTMIHEYQHYLQSPAWFTRYYNMGYDYNTHPYEVQARKAELNWYRFTRVQYMAENPFKMEIVNIS